ncbi:MAG: NifU family protein [Chitinophagales bacterium]
MTDIASLEKKIEMSLDTMRSYLQADGGDIEIIEITEDMTVKLRFIGNCQDCMQIKMTSASIEEAIKNYIPIIKKVEYID